MKGSYIHFPSITIFNLSFQGYFEDILRIFDFSRVMW